MLFFFMELQIRFHTCKDKSYTAFTTIGMYRFMDFCTSDTQSSEQDVHYSIHSFHEGAYLCRKQINKHGYEKQLYQTDPTCQPFLQRA